MAYGVSMDRHGHDIYTLEWSYWASDGIDGLIKFMEIVFSYIRYRIHFVVSIIRILVVAEQISARLFINFLHRQERSKSATQSEPP